MELARELAGVGRFPRFTALTTASVFLSLSHGEMTELLVILRRRRPGPFHRVEEV